MTDQPTAPAPVQFSTLILLTGWQGSVLSFDGHPIPVLTVVDAELGPRHYAWPREALDGLKKWLNAPETETALAVGVQGKAN